MGTLKAPSHFDLSVEHIIAARERIRHLLHPTGLLNLSPLLNWPFPVMAKLENAQLTGSFKIRGALNRILQLSDDEKKQGVVASSAGNHAQGVAKAARLTGVEAVVVMPENTPWVKVSATRELGAQVILHGQVYDEAFELAQKIEREEGRVFIPPFENPMIIAGQGTTALEILENFPEVTQWVIPCGGGGLLSGMALAIKSLRPQARIWGVQSSKLPSMANRFLGLPAPNDFQPTLAEGIAIKKPSEIIYQKFLQPYVDEFVTVSDEEIAEAMCFLLERGKTVSEGAGACGIAALLMGHISIEGPTAVVVSGGNVDLNTLAKIIEKGQLKRGRLTTLSVVVSDLPGRLSEITQVLAELNANILEIYHDRVSEGLVIRETEIRFVLETLNHQHIETIRHRVESLGARIVS